MKGSTELRVRVRYAETDAMGIAHHTSFLVWFEEARSEYLRIRGGDYRELERKGVHLPVVELTCRYLAPARYGDLLIVETWLAHMDSRTLTFRYRVRMAETGEELATGSTRHVCVDGEGRVRRLPQEVRALGSTKCPGEEDRAENRT